MQETLLAPEGYQFFYVFRYPKKFASFSFLLYVLLCLVFCVIIAINKYPSFPGLPNSIQYWIVVLPLPIIDILRALIQRSTSRLLGYVVSFNAKSRVFLPEIYTAEPGQFQKRSHTSFIALIPLGVFLCIFVIFTSLGMSNLSVFFLLVSIVRTVGDLYFVWRLLWMPTGALIYNVTLKEKLIFKPKSYVKELPRHL